MSVSEWKHLQFAQRAERLNGNCSLEEKGCCVSLILLSSISLLPLMSSFFHEEAQGAEVGPRERWSLDSNYQMKMEEGKDEPPGQEQGKMQWQLLLRYSFWFLQASRSTVMGRSKKRTRGCAALQQLPSDFRGNLRHVRIDVTLHNSLPQPNSGENNTINIGVHASTLSWPYWCPWQEAASYSELQRSIRSIDLAQEGQWSGFLPDRGCQKRLQK